MDKGKIPRCLSFTARVFSYAQSCSAPRGYFPAPFAASPASSHRQHMSRSNCAASTAPKRGRSALCPLLPMGWHGDMSATGLWWGRCHQHSQEGRETRYIAPGSINNHGERRCPSAGTSRSQKLTCEKNSFVYVSHCCTWGLL